MKKLEIYSENSAQGTTSKPNPFVQPVLEELVTNKRYGLNRNIKLVDLGCGKLRHFDICKRLVKQIILVDTKKQIERVQKFASGNCTMRQYVDSTNEDGDITISVLPIEEFERQKLNADIVLSVAVMDAVLKDARSLITRSAFQNLRSGGFFVVIVPRNDSSLLVNCKETNRYQDGFVFRNRGHDTLTFYANFRDPVPLMTIMTENGFDLLENLSVFRQLCWILKKP